MLRRSFIGAMVGCGIESEADLRIPLLHTQQTFETPAIVADGDSITRGYGLATPATMNWFARMCADARLADLDFVPTNSGTDSETVAQMLADVATDVDAHFVANARFVRTVSVGSIAILFGGTNSLYFSVPEATLRAQQITWCEGRRELGFYTAIATMLPRGGDAPGTFDAGRTANNTFWRSNWEDHADLLIDWGDIAQGADVENATYYQDEVHPTAALAQLLGTFAADAFAEVLEL